jgi:hypothetical protein
MTEEIRHLDMKTFYDCFICHNSKDKDCVDEICQHLKQTGFSVWKDDDSMRPGVWLTRIIEAIASSKVLIVFIGPHGLGGIQQTELSHICTRVAEDNSAGSCVAIPVYLKNYSEDIKYNESYKMIKIYEGVCFKRDVNPLEKLVYYIQDFLEKSKLYQYGIGVERMIEVLEDEEISDRKQKHVINLKLHAEEFKFLIDDSEKIRTDIISLISKNYQTEKHSLTYIFDDQKQLNKIFERMGSILNNLHISLMYSVDEKTELSYEPFRLSSFDFDLASEEVYIEFIKLLKEDISIRIKNKDVLKYVNTRMRLLIKDIESSIAE